MGMVIPFYLLTLFAIKGIIMDVIVIEGKP